jgi:hypothetical protein
MDTIELKEGARQLVEIIDSYTIVGKEMLSNCSKIKGDASGNLTYQQHTLMQLLERITYNSLSVKLILQEYIRTGNEHYEYSAGLLFRNCCSDIITLMYLNNLGADVQLTSDQIEERVKYFLGEELIKAVDFFGEEHPQYAEYAQNLANEYHTLVKFENGKLLNKHPKMKEVKFSTTGMIKAIPNYIKFTKHLDVLWKQYSQYEHLGGLTYKLLRLPFQSKINDMSHVLYNIIWSMFFFSKNISAPEFNGDEYYKKVEDCMKIYAKYFPIKHVDVSSSNETKAE